MSNPHSVNLVVTTIDTQGSGSRFWELRQVTRLDIFQNSGPGQALTMKQFIAEKPADSGFPDFSKKRSEQAKSLEQTRKEAAIGSSARVAKRH